MDYEASQKEILFNLRENSIIVTESGFYNLTGERQNNYGSDISNHDHVTFSLNVKEQILYRANLNQEKSFETPLGYLSKGDSVYIDYESDLPPVDYRFSIVKQQSENVAEYQKGYQTVIFPEKWSYQNSTSPDVKSNVAVIGNPSDYQNLIWKNDAYVDSNNSLYLNNNRVRIGNFREKMNESNQGQYLIVSYEVEESGYFAINNSRLEVPSDENTNSIEVLIHIDNHSPIFRESVKSSEKTLSFDTHLAYLEPGSRIYVCMGSKQIYDKVQFEFDFNITRLGGAKSISAQIEDATGPELRLFPARYYADAQQIDLRSVNDFKLYGYGVHYIQTNKDERFITLFDCHNVQIMGITMDYDPILFIQGEILDIDENKITLKAHTEYATPDPTEAPYRTKATLHDPSTMQWKLETSIAFVKNVTETDTDGIYVLQMSAHPLNLTNWEVGDYMSWYRKGIGSPVLLNKCRNTVLKDITMHQYSDWGVSSTYGAFNTYDNLRLTPGPKPLLADVQRMRAGDKDGINLSSSEGPSILNCLIEANCDDAIHVWGKLYIALEDSKLSRTLHVTSRDNEIIPGMEIYIQSEGGKEVRKIVSVSPSPYSAEEAAKMLQSHFPTLNLKLGFPKNRIKVLLDEPVNVDGGDLLYLPSRSGKGLKIKNTTINNNMGRGIVVKCIDGVIENNYISYIGGQGVKVEVEAKYWGTGGFTENLLIRGNHFKSVAAHTDQTHRIYKAGAIQIHCTGLRERRFSDIRIEDNIFEDIYGVNVVITDAVNVHLKGNRFINPGHRTSQSGLQPEPTIHEAIVWLSNISDVKFSETTPNVFINKEPNMKNITGGPFTGQIYPGISN